MGLYCEEGVLLVVGDGFGGLIGIVELLLGFLGITCPRSSSMKSSKTKPPPTEGFLESGGVATSDVPWFLSLINCCLTSCSTCGPRAGTGCGKTSSSNSNLLLGWELVLELELCLVEEFLDSLDLLVSILPEAGRDKLLLPLWLELFLKLFLKLSLKMSLIVTLWLSLMLQR